jgi:hypothetical protein
VRCCWIPSPVMPSRIAWPAVRYVGGFCPGADSGGRAGGDHIAGSEAHEVADVRDEVRHVENHRTRVAPLKPMAIHLELEIEFLGIGHLIGRHEPRAERGEGVAPLPLSH